MKSIVTTFSLVSGLLVGTVAFAEGDLDTFAARLTELRTEVETLSTEVERQKEARRAGQRSIAAQRADIEFQLQREERRVAQLHAQAEKRKQTVAESAVDGDELRPAIANSMDALRGRVQTGLPFKVTERLGALDALDKKLRDGLVSPQKGSVYLWALVEDELRLGRENGLYRQVIELDGEELLVEVARLGMVAMYFRADDGRVGRVLRSDDRWEWRAEDQEGRKRQIDTLFEAMRKQIRTGYFELPGPIGGGVK